MAEFNETQRRNNAEAAKKANKTNIKTLDREESEDKADEFIRKAGEAKGGGGSSSPRMNPGESLGDFGARRKAWLADQEKSESGQKVAAQRKVIGGK